MTPNPKNYYSSKGVFLHKLYALAVLRNHRDRREIKQALAQ